MDWDFMIKLKSYDYQELTSQIVAYILSGVSRKTQRCRQVCESPVAGRLMGRLGILKLRA